MTVPPAEAERARALMLGIFPAGFEEAEVPDGLELAAYTDAAGEERLWATFGGARSTEIELGWEERWRAFHRPVRVGPLWVGPPWEEPPRGAIAVVIEPGRAFGTGAHATTRLCLGLLLELRRGSLLDVGCGSGVLAVSAAKIGFAPVHAVDFDPLAVEATRLNAEANGVEVEVVHADALAGDLPSADSAVVNVTLEAVRSLAGQLDCNWLVSSGYLASDAPDLPGFFHVGRHESEGWAADLQLRRQ